MLPFPRNQRQWYRFQVSSGTVHISVEPSAWQMCAERLSSTSHTIHDVTLVQSKHPDALPIYRSPTTRGGWGFGEVLHLAEARHGWIEWVCLLPRVHSRNEADMRHARAVAMSLSVLFRALNQYGLERMDPTEDIAEQQLAIVSLYATSGFVGYPLSAHLSPAVAAGIRRTIGAQHGHVPLQNVDIAMAEAYYAMADRSIALPDRTSSMLLLPCGVYLNFPKTQSVMRGSEHPETHIIELTSDKIESPERQLTFLAGIARLIDVITPKIL